MILLALRTLAFAFTTSFVAPAFAQGYMCSFLFQTDLLIPGEAEIHRLYQGIDTVSRGAAEALISRENMEADTRFFVRHVQAQMVANFNISVGILAQRHPDLAEFLLDPSIKLSVAESSSILLSISRLKVAPGGLVTVVLRPFPYFVEEVRAARRLRQSQSL